MPKTRAELVDGLTVTYGPLAEELTRSLRRRGASADDAADLVSASFAILLSLSDDHIARIDNERAYLHAIARNLHTRSQAEQRRTVVVSNDELDIPVDSADLTQIENAQLRQIAARAFSSLNSAQQRMIFASTVRGESVREIAKAEGVSTTNATTLISRAKSDLRVAYAAELFSTTPPRCGFDTHALAQIVVGTAGKRVSRAYEAHVVDCSTCPPLVASIRHDLGRGTTLVLLVVLGGLGTSGIVLGDVSAARAEAAPGGRRHLAIALGALILAAGTWMALSGSSDSPTRPEPVPASPEAVPARGGALSAWAPSAVDLPAPGQSVGWYSGVRSDAEAARHLFASVWVETAAHSGTTPPALSLSLRSAEGQAVVPTLSTARSKLIYLGVIGPDDTFVVRNDVARDPTDADQNARASLGTTYWVSDSVEPGLRVGETVERPSELAASGVDGAALAAVAGAGILLSAVGILAARCRDGRRPRSRLELGSKKF